MNHKIAVNLEDGVTYVNGYGERHTIAGTCKGYPDWCWSVQGEWFERASGTRIAYDLKTGQYSVSQHASWRNLWKEEQSNG